MVRIGPWGAATLVLLALPAHAGSLEQSSWGKPGISYADYQGDSLKCGLIGHHQDVSNTAAAQTLRRATSDLQANEAGLVNQSPAEQIGTAITSARIVEGARPEKRFAEVKAFQVDAVSKCLTALGYVRFRLTRDEAGQLRRLLPGSEARRQFLHRLASRDNVADFAIPIDQAN